VLNAVILASYDRQQTQVRALTQAAFDAVWALQDSNGGWNWQDFQLAPWETADSGFFGASMLLLSARRLPASFLNDAGNRSHLERLQEYLRALYPSQPLINRLYVLWASSELPALLDHPQRRALLDELRRLQQIDGGWRSAGLNRIEREDHSPAPTRS